MPIISTYHRFELIVTKPMNTGALTIRIAVPYLDGTLELKKEIRGCSLAR